MIRSEYFSDAATLGIVLVEDPEPAASLGVDVGVRTTVSVDDDGRAIVIDVLDPEQGLDDLDLVAAGYGLDPELLEAAARAALAAPDREVTIEFGARAAA